MDGDAYEKGEFDKISQVKDTTLTDVILPTEFADPVDLCNYSYSDGYLLTFTDGSVSNGTHMYLARAGWGVFYGPNSKLNTNAPLRGPIQTSNRAEIRTILHVMRTAVVPTRVWADCKGVVDTYQDIINNQNSIPKSAPTRIFGK